MRNAISLILLALTFTATQVAAQQTVPVLRYTPPANAYRSAAAGPAEDYSLNGVNASVQVYQFRPFTGDIQKACRATLLRDWIVPLHQEERLGRSPTFQTVNVPGAQLALAASFAENTVGLAKPRMRMLIVAGGQAAIVDASAGTAQSWQRAVPVLNAMAATLRVEAERAPPPLSPAAGSAVAGLYQGFKVKYMATMNNIVGSGGTTPMRCTTTSFPPTGASIAPMTSSMSPAETSRASISMQRNGETRRIPGAIRSMATS